jgi:hypothetical protein
MNDPRQGVAVIGGGMERSCSLVKETGSREPVVTSSPLNHPLPAAAWVRRCQCHWAGADGYGCANGYHARCSIRWWIYAC